MIVQSPDRLESSAPKDDMLHAAANVARRGEYGTMILDRGGRVLSCGEPAEKIFRTRHAELLGRKISEFVEGLFRAGSSPSYCARHLVYLCSNGDWRDFQAMDIEGHRFAVELNLSRIVTDGQEMFLLNVRRADDTTPPAGLACEGARCAPRVPPSNHA